MAAQIDLDTGLRSKWQTRRETWGDVGTQAVTTQHFPRFEPLPTLLRQLNASGPCNPTAANLGRSNPDLDRRLAQLRIPDSQKCLATAAIAAQSLLREHQTQDRRYNQALDQLNRTQRAKKHLDRARQLYSVALALMRKGVDTLRVGDRMPADSPQRLATLREGQGHLRRAQSLVYNTVPGNPQTPKPGKKSALSELFAAYALIRDYEMNPLPPLTVEGRPNMPRVAEDTTYTQLMGSDRMEPNRLALGPWARTVWLQNGLFDPNYYTRDGLRFDAQDPQGEPRQPRLYFNVTADSPLGPQQWVAYQDAMQHQFGSALSSAPLQAGRYTVAQLQSGGFSPRRLSTDASRALLDVHQHFLAALPALRTPSEAVDGWQGRRVPSDGDAWIRLPADQRRGLAFIERVPRIAAEPPPALVEPPYATPGVANSNPRNQGRPSIFYPTALRGVQVDPHPVLGVPDTSLGYWDARVSCQLLQSHSAHLMDELQQCKERDQMQTMATEDSERPPSLQPLTWWKDGPVVPLATTPTRQSADWPAGNTHPERRNVTLVQRPVAWDPEQPFPQGPRFVPEGMPSETQDGAPVRWRGSSFRYGTPESAAPRRGRPVVVTQPANATYNRMLQHALFLLGAPTTSFQRTRLPQSLWNSAPLQYQRWSDGTWRTPSQPGWLVLTDPAPKGATRIVGNLGYPRTRVSQSRLQQDEIKNLIESDQPVGPFSLDELFGEPGHLPSASYHPEAASILTVHHNVWVVRTNQQFVYGHDTLGLDFY